MRGKTMQTTKDIIFNTAVELFSEKGYDNVSTREIARAADVNESTAYYYYKSKKALLDDILAVYQRKLERYLITRGRVERYLKTDTPRELLQRLLPHFKDEEAVFMLRANRIVCMAQHTNPKARDIVMDHLMDKTAKSIKDALDVLMEHGLIPVFDTKPFSVIWCDFMYSQGVKHANRYFYGETEQLRSGDFSSYGNALIDAALAGKLPGAHVQYRHDRDRLI